jgi:uncharacterized RDD family membrane protein YckC
MFTPPTTVRHLDPRNVEPMQPVASLDPQGRQAMVRQGTTAPRRRGIVTPEAVVLEFETAGIASRALAKLIDLVILGLLLSLVLMFVGLVSVAAGESTAFSVIVSVIAGFLALFGYWCGLETWMRGRTVGKAALGLRVVTVEGGPIRFRHAFLRAVGGIVDFVIPPGGSVAIATALVTPRMQRLGDLAAGTMVLRDRRAAGLAAAVSYTLPPGEFADFHLRLDTSGLQEADYLALRRFLLRSKELTPAAHAHLVAQLDSHLQQRLRVSRPVHLHPEWFLQCVGAAYQLRTGRV